MNWLIAYLAWGMATSPLPIVALALVMLGKRPLQTSVSYTSAWAANMAVGISVGCLAAHGVARVGISAGEKRVVGHVLVALGVVLIAYGLFMLWRTRGRPSDSESVVRFLERAQNAGPREVAVLASVAGLLNLTNYPYFIGIGLLVERDQSAPALVLITFATFVASSTFLITIAIMMAFGDRITPRLERGRAALLKHSGAVLPGVLLTAGAMVLLLGLSDSGVI